MENKIEIDTKKYCVLISGFDKQLDEMEMKIKGTVGKRTQSSDQPEEIQIGDIVAVFFGDMNKWIRGIIKAKDDKGLVYVFAVDYGVPLISNAVQILKLPPIYAKMNVKYQRVHLGGIINCVPAESKYDFEKESVVLREQNDWSANAIEIAQNFIGRAVNLKFDEVEQVRFADGPHLFGHLKIQKADGSWIDLNDCLCEASVAKITDDTWANHAHRLDTINQKEWLAMDGMLFQGEIGLSRISHERIVNEVKLQSTCQEKYQPSYKPRNQVNQQVATGTQNENDDNQHLNSSAGSSRVFNRRSTSQTRNIRGGHGGFGGRGGHFRGDGRPNNYHQHHADNIAQFPKEWLSNGKLNDKRYREDIEYFESGFRPPNQPNKKEESLTSSPENVVDKSKDMKPDGNGSIENVNNGNDAKDEKPTKIESTEMVPLDKVPTKIKTSEIEAASISEINAQNPKKDDTVLKQNGSINNNNSSGTGSQVNMPTQNNCLNCSHSDASNNQKAEQPPNNSNIEAKPE